MIHALALDFAAGIAVCLTGTTHRGDGGTKDGNASTVQARNHLVVGRQEAVADTGERRNICGRSTQVVDTLVDYGVPSSRLSNNVALEPRQCAGSKSIVEYTVSSGGLVSDGNVLR